MRNTKARFIQALVAATAVCGAGLMTGCTSGFNASSPPVVQPGVALKGAVHGGQQPIAGAAVYLYAANTTAYSGATSNLLTSPVFSDAGGNFSLTGKYNCTPGQQFYIVSVGGNPGAGVNSAAALMAGLGDCSNLNANTFIQINEVTTVATAYALAPFMADYAHVGSSATNTAGLSRAFQNVNKLANISSGFAGGPMLPAGATLPTAEIYTLANIVAACINSTGGVAGDGSACGTLFADVTPAGGTAPVDAIGLALALAKNPTLNVGLTFNYATATSPFNPQLASAPSDWTLSITYSAGGLNHPKTTTVDTAGNIWVANSGNNTVSLISQTGAPVSGSPFSGNGLNAPAVVAIDSTGNAWVANKGGSAVSAFTASGTAMSGSPFNGSGTISAPSAIAIDAPGNIWIANSGNKTITELNSGGGYMYQSSSTATAPSSIAINPK
jgi:hypothetical protein